MIKNGAILLKKACQHYVGIASNHNGDFYCLNCFHSYSTKNRLKKHERLCNDHDDCHVKMPDEDNKILK